MAKLARPLIAIALASYIGSQALPRLLAETQAIPAFTATGLVTHNHAIDSASIQAAIEHQQQAQQWHRNAQRWLDLALLYKALAGQSENQQQRQNARRHALQAIEHALQLAPANPLMLTHLAWMRWRVPNQRPHTIDALRAASLAAPLDPTLIKTRLKLWLIALRAGEIYQPQDIALLTEQLQLARRYTPDAYTKAIQASDMQSIATRLTNSP